MTTDFRTVFAGIAVGSAEDADQYLVDDILTILDVTIVNGVCLGIRKVFGWAVVRSLVNIRERISSA